MDDNDPRMVEKRRLLKELGPPPQPAQPEPDPQEVDAMRRVASGDAVVTRNLRPPAEIAAEVLPCEYADQRGACVPPCHACAARPAVTAALQAERERADLEVTLHDDTIRALREVNKRLESGDSYAGHVLARNHLRSYPDRALTGGEDHADKG